MSVAVAVVEEVLEASVDKLVVSDVVEDAGDVDRGWLEFDTAPVETVWLEVRDELLILADADVIESVLVEDAEVVAFADAEVVKNELVVKPVRVVLRLPDVNVVISELVVALAYTIDRVDAVALVLEVTADEVELAFAPDW